jgi:REase_DpnII-MboI
MGREIFPSDRNSFIHVPIELIGIALGVTACTGAKGHHRTWLASAIQRGFLERRFIDPTAQIAAASTEWLVNPTQSEGRHSSTTQTVEDLTTADLIFFNSLALLVPERGVVDPAGADRELLKRALSGSVPSRDTAEAAGVYVSLARAVERLVANPVVGADPTAIVVTLCRRFQLFVDRLQARQRSRQSLTVADEYDVQDLLHGILKLHFDDVRPEEWTPSYAGNASRINFLLPRERMIIEAKMTRQGLGQKEVVNELIVDVARYAKFPNVDSLLCLIYDPARRCTNPAALEDDLGNSEGWLRVVAVVCPRGT